MNVITNVILIAVLSMGLRVPVSAFQAREMNTAEIRLGLRKLAVLGSVLYIAAHPDDENSTLLTYFEKERLLRTGYLALTRGEGGQNLIGPEKGDVLGIIRTEELLAARKIDGAEQFFTRAIDFGYSKNSPEAIGFWGEEEILSDIVRVIRTFRPDVIITRFSHTIGGHGQHTASAILARKAFELSGDPGSFPDQLDSLTPWSARRLLFNGSSFMLRQYDTTGALRLNIGGYNPLLGKSYNEISGLSRSMHKSQGFGARQSRGDVINYFRHTAGDSAASDMFEGIDIGWSRIPGSEGVARLLRGAHDNFNPDDPAAILPLLLRAYQELGTIENNVWTEVKRGELLEIIQACAGLWIDALAGDFSAAPGDTVTITASAINRSNFDFTLRRLSLSPVGSDSVVRAPLSYNAMNEFAFTVVVPADEPPTVPYWLQEYSNGFRYDVPDASDVGTPGRPSPWHITFTVASGVTEFTVVAPVRYGWVDPVEGQLYRPFIVTPPVLMNPGEKVLLFPSRGEKSLTVRLTAGKGGATGTVHLETPPGWNSSPESIPFSIPEKNGEERVTFSLVPSDGAQSGSFSVSADAGGALYRHSVETVRYGHIPRLSVFQPAGGRVITLDLARKKGYLGYIAGSGDDVPDALRQVGYDVRILSDEDLASADLRQFQSIIAGVRAYNTRPALAAAHGRLMEYVSDGGTYVVQYVTSRNKKLDEIGPFPFRISRDRVSDETAPVTILAPDHPALNYPNRIDEMDFSGWVQERGLYFADEWDPSYIPLVSSHDPGEPSRSGGLIVARHGGGYYCYAGLSFFRQLPAGVTGAYRLFVNLIELGTMEKTGNGN